MLDLFWDLRQEQRLAELETKTSRTTSPSNDPVYMLNEFQSRIDRLSIICLAMWQLLQEISDLKEDDLLKKVTEIDLSDGKLDGKVQAQATQCPQCNRMISVKHKRCLYCGYEVTGQLGVFDKVIE